MHVNKKDNFQKLILGLLILNYISLKKKHFLTIIRHWQIFRKCSSLFKDARLCVLKLIDHVKKTKLFLKSCCEKMNSFRGVIHVVKHNIIQIYAYKLKLCQYLFIIIISKHFNIFRIIFPEVWFYSLMIFKSEATL